MRVLVAAVALTAMLGSGGASAQSQLDHQVQKTWDNLFNPGPPGDPRTNWERRREAERYNRREAERYDEQRAGRDQWDRRRESERADWCRYHPGADGCGRYYGGAPGYYGR